MLKLTYLSNFQKIIISLSFSFRFHSFFLFNQYGSITVYGVNGQETVQVDGKIVKDFQMVFAWSEGPPQGQYQRADCNDGIMGLSNKQSYQNIFQQAQKQGVIKSSRFAFDLTGDGKFYYDEIPSQFMNAPYIPATLDDRWTFRIIGLEINGEDITSELQYKDALVDSGTSTTILDQSIIDRVLKSSENFVKDPQNGGLCSINNCAQCNCLSKENLPTIVFYSYGAKIIFPPKAYMVSISTDCILALDDSSVLGMTIFGDNFMRQLIVTYDKDENEMYFKGFFTSHIFQNIYRENSFFMTNPNTFAIFIIICIGYGFNLLSLIFLVYRACKTKQSLYQQSNYSSFL